MSVNVVGNFMISLRNVAKKNGKGEDKPKTNLISLPNEILEKIIIELATEVNQLALEFVMRERICDARPLAMGERPRYSQRHLLELPDNSNGMQRAQHLSPCLENFCICPHSQLSELEPAAKGLVSLAMSCRHLALLVAGPDAMENCTGMVQNVSDNHKDWVMSNYVDRCVGPVGWTMLSRYRLLDTSGPGLHFAPYHEALEPCYDYSTQSWQPQDDGLYTWTRDGRFQRGRKSGPNRTQRMQLAMRNLKLGLASKMRVLKGQLIKVAAKVYESTGKAPEVKTAVRPTPANAGLILDKFNMQIDLQQGRLWCFFVRSWYISEVEEAEYLRHTRTWADAVGRYGLAAHTEERIRQLEDQMVDYELSIDTCKGCGGNRQEWWWHPDPAGSMDQAEILHEEEVFNLWLEVYPRRVSRMKDKPWQKDWNKTCWLMSKRSGWKWSDGEQEQHIRRPCIRA